MGCSLALFLARRGARVTLFEAAPVLFSGASRWNEGKIHLGYLYAGDPSLSTARKVLPGGLAFRGLVEELTGTSLLEAITQEDDIYLTHRKSVIDPESMGRYFAAVTDLVCSHPNARSYLVDARQAKLSALNRRELKAISDSRAIIAGFRVPERSVRTTWLADRFADAVQNEPGISLALGTRVMGVKRHDQRWTIDSAPVTDCTFDIVVNALGQGRLSVDRTAGLIPEECWSHRYRLSLFASTTRTIDQSSAVIATGPFGDIKNYDGRHFYLSWYPAGLLLNDEGTTSPEPPTIDAGLTARVAENIITALRAHLPGTERIVSAIAENAVEGGWVVAQGTGALSDPASSLHRRDRFGASFQGSYVAVDTGKYSTAPWLARGISDRIMPG